MYILTSCLNKLGDNCIVF